MCIDEHIPIISGYSECINKASVTAFNMLQKHDPSKQQDILTAENSDPEIQSQFELCSEVLS